MDTWQRVKKAGDFCRPTPEGLAAAKTVLTSGSGVEKLGVKATLKPHQVDGVAWLIERYARGVNSILGDEMGLGKTLQAITFLAYLLNQRGSQGPFLVLCPLSVTEGWASELARFAPGLRVVRYTGERAQREDIRKRICEHVNAQPPAARKDPPLTFDILLTTYELAMMDAPFLSRVRWRYTVIDEAHRLKNPASVLYGILTEQYMIPRKLLLTGTPVQNNLAELWSLLHFCMPSIFNDPDGFVAAFSPKQGGSSVGADVASRESGDSEGEAPDAERECSANAESRSTRLLQHAVKSFMLRRTKAALVRAGTLQLPPLSEITMFVDLSKDPQKEVYVSILKKELPRIVSARGNVGDGSRVALHSVVIQLRKACSHPYLFDGIEPEPFQEGEHLVQACGKLLALDALLRKLKEGGHRVLIYAQMTRTLDILQDYLEYRRYSYERLDGSVRAEERFAAVRSFSKTGPQGSSDTGGDGEAFVFLLTTRAGCVGVNLTAADTVIFYEQDWNPQADKQAVQRAHRIGQSKPVLAISLVTRHTVEEVIMRRAHRKLRLTREVIGREDADVADDVVDSSSTEDLHTMITFGLHQLAQSGCEVDKPGGSSSSADVGLRAELAKAVDLALAHRGGQPLPSVDLPGKGLVELVEAEEGFENIYEYEGTDYSSARATRRGVRTSDDEAKDKRAEDERVLDTWRADMGAAPDLARPKAGVRRKVEGGDVADRDRDEERKLRAELAETERRRKADKRRDAKWHEKGYLSLAVKDEEEMGAGEREEEEGEEQGVGIPSRNVEVEFVVGDCTKPRRGKDGEPAIVFCCVDTSGAWGMGGMFRAVACLSDSISAAYERAHDAGDLHLGDLHLVPVLGSQEAKRPTSEAGEAEGPSEEEEREEEKDEDHRRNVVSTSSGGHGKDTESPLYVGLGVVQEYNARRKVPRSDIIPSALDTCLSRLASAALSLKASVHMPRVGARPGQGRGEWYAVERLLRKRLTGRGIPTFVYYYARHS